MVEIGDTAPSAMIWKTNPDGEAERQFDLNSAYSNGTTVLYFFPGAFTGVCTNSTCDLRDQFKDFEELKAQLFGVSVDLPFSQGVFMKQNELNYPLLSDFNKELISKFGIVDDDFVGFKGVAKRSLFLVKDKKIAFKWVADVPTDYPTFDDLKEALN